MSWKKIGTYIGGAITFIFVISLCYYTSYHNALDDFNKNSVYQDNTLVSYLKELTNKYENQYVEEDNTKSVDTTKELTVQSNMKYTLECYDVETNQTIIESKEMPAKFIGLTRKEVIDLISKEMKQPSIDEYQKGLISYVLISFSKDEMILRKSYDQKIIPYQYYIAIYDDQVIVYYGDRKTIYEYTGIDARNLSEKNQAELAQGRKVKDEEELYNLLESYSS